jgi:hypothetical protein
MPIESTQHWVREMGANLEILPENLEIQGKPKSNSEYLQFLIRIPWASLRPLQSKESLCRRNLWRKGKSIR